MKSFGQSEDALQASECFNTTQSSAKHTGSTFYPKEIRIKPVTLQALWALTGLNFVGRRKPLLVANEPADLIQLQDGDHGTETFLDN
jgi:hypothetical protein